MKTHIIYHQVKQGVDCPDGIAAAWVAFHKYGDDDTAVIGCTYEMAKDPNSSFHQTFAPFEGDLIVVVDFSFPSSVIQAWVNKGFEVILVDHHKTALEDLAEFGDRVVDGYTQHFDMAECGATLAWKTFFPGEPVPTFLQYIRDRDLWLWELPSSQEVNEGLANVRWKLKGVTDGVLPTDEPCGLNIDLIFTVFSYLASTEVYGIAWLKSVGEPIIAAKNEKVAAIAHRYDMVRFPQSPNSWLHPENDETSEFWDVPVVRLAEDGSEDRLVSDICSFLYKTLVPGCLFVGCIASDGSWSLRSDRNGSNFDVGSLAKSLGGGGHHNAAGFKVSHAT